MVTFPNAKINLGLRVVEKRPDGYHNLDTVFYPVPLYDALECIRSDTDHFTASGLDIPGDSTTNLCLKALELLRKNYPSIGPFKIHLHKHIPMGAGLGGGSSNGAFMLNMLNDTFQLGLTTVQLIDYSLQLGSDCPYFIVNQPVHATGRGEHMTPLSCDLSRYTFLLIDPGVHISTAQAFARIEPHHPARMCSDIVQQPVSTWKKELVNDFESSVFPIYPQLAEIKQQLYALGAVYASMTGTGSAMYGIFEQEPDWHGRFSPLYTVHCLIP